MRLALVHPFPWPEVRRGAERYLHDLSRYLCDQGHEVTIITGTARPGWTERRLGTVVVHRRHLRLRGMHRLGCTEVETFGARALVPLLRHHAEVVHAFTPSAALAGRMAGRPTVYTVLGHPVPEQWPTAATPRRLFERAVHHATVTATLSTASQDALRRACGAASVVLPAGVYTQQFPPRLGARIGPPRILFCGSLADDRKRVDLVVAVLAMLLDRHRDVRLAVSGEGDLHAALRRAARLGAPVDSRVEDAIDVLGLGDPSGLPARYRAASVTLLPAEHEALGLVLLESLASGTPIACTPSGGMPEIVDGLSVGRVAADASVEALAEATESAISLSRLRDTALRCSDRAHRWDWTDSVGPAHERLYRELAPQHRRAPELMVR
jgi:phosphatidyl-myo-inositol alpha-mannosyltransferase